MNEIIRAVSFNDPAYIDLTTAEGDTVRCEVGPARDKNGILSPDATNRIAAMMLASPVLFMMLNDAQAYIEVPQHSAAMRDWILKGINAAITLARSEVKP